jgi:hypothetical protein
LTSNIHGNRNDGLVRRTVTDCTGRTTHALVLRVDGLVEVSDTHGGRALIDPRLRTCLTPNAHIADPVMDMATSLIELS